MNKYRIKPNHDKSYSLQELEGKSYITVSTVRGLPEALNHIINLERPIIEIPDAKKPSAITKIKKKLTPKPSTKK
jgi:hypothetical protein